MNSMFAPTVPIGRLEWDAAQAVLQSCSPQRQTAALPYLLSLYSFMTWWETDAQADDPDLERELTLTTTWCEQPEVLELINLADLAIEGTQLSFYPVESGDTFAIHCPTFLGVLNADLAVVVELNRDHRWAKLRGYLDRAGLVQFWQLNPPDSDGYSQIPLDILQPIYYLPEQISYLQPRTSETPGQKVVTKTNRNPATLDLSNINELTGKLLQLGIAPVPTPPVAQASTNTPENQTQSVKRLIALLHGVSDKSVV